MANTYTQLLVQLVFAVKYRKSMIHENIREDIQKYMTGIVKKTEHKPLAIYCMPDHCHLLVGLNPNRSISELAGAVKSNSSKWINQEKIVNSRFEWQKGYGAFGYSKSQLDRVVKYILNQPQHHRRKTFEKEYLGFLNKFEIEYDEKYLFEWIV